MADQGAILRLSRVRKEPWELNKLRLDLCHPRSYLQTGTLGKSPKLLKLQFFIYKMEIHSHLSWRAITIKCSNM